MKLYKIYLSMAALALVGIMMSSCAEEIEVAQPANTGKTVMVKTTVSLGENATTRTLTEAGVKTFAEGDQIAVIYKNTSDETVKVESVALTAADIGGDAHNATFTVVLTNPNPGGAVRYIYPASRAATTVATDAAVNASATVNYADLATQDGTFAKASTLDLATFDGTLTDSGTLPATASLTNPLTIGKFTIKNSGGTDITSSIIEMKISDGSNTYTITPTTALSTFYVAMHAVSSSQTVILNATDGTNHYTKSVTNNTLAASNIYAITVNTIAGANLSLVTANYTALNGEVLSGTLGCNVKISIDDGATVTLSGVYIRGELDERYKWAGITCVGDATIILADGSRNEVVGFYNNYPGIYIPSGKTLTIKGGTLGTGYLEAWALDGVGIGGSNCGNIKIEGGDIEAVGRNLSAGIGSGKEGYCGNITISGGKVKAAGGMGAAGIGSGYECNCGNISISGGTVESWGYSTGIGCGEAGSCGDISISGGTVISSGFVGIGSSIGYEKRSICGNISISGGTVDAEGGCGDYIEADSGVGIGSCDQCGDISISGGTVTASMDDYSSGAGIGTGTESICGAIIISGGVVNAKGSYDAAGIGSGKKGKFTSINITSGITNVIATKADNGTVPIGKGTDDKGSGTVTIAGKTVPTSGSWDGTGMTGLTLTGAGTNTWTLSHGAASAGPGDLGKVIGADGNIYTTVAQASAAGTTAEAMIAYVGSASNCTHGLAIALESASDCTWDELSSKLSTFAASYPVNNGVWRVPSVTDLRYIFAACGGAPVTKPIVDVGHPMYAEDGEDYSPGKLVSMASNLGYNMQTIIWTSTPKDDDYSWNYWLIDDDLGCFTSQYTKIMDHDALNRYGFLPILAF